MMVTILCREITRSTTVLAPLLQLPYEPCQGGTSALVHKCYIRLVEHFFWFHLEIAAGNIPLCVAAQGFKLSGYARTRSGGGGLSQVILLAIVSRSILYAIYNNSIVHHYSG